MISSNASLSYAEIAASRVSPDQVLFFQLYKHSKEAALQRVREIEQLGYKAIFLTVDAPFPGNRERDTRSAWELDDIEAAGQGTVKTDVPMTSDLIEDMENEVATGGQAASLLATADVDMTWDDVRG